MGDFRRGAVLDETAADGRLFRIGCGFPASLMLREDSPVRRDAHLGP